MRLFDFVVKNKLLRHRQMKAKQFQYFCIYREKGGRGGGSELVQMDFLKKSRNLSNIFVQREFI
jgi:hypothetical protein